MESPPLTPSSSDDSAWTAEEREIARVFLQLAGGEREETQPELPQVPSNMAPPTVATKFQAPQFSMVRPDLFFGALETQFDLHGITDEKEKYGKLVVVVRFDELEEKACEMIIRRPEDEPYSKLKAAIMEIVAPADLNQVRLLLSKEKLGDLKPSELLARMRRIGTREGADKVVAEADIRDAWLLALPKRCQMMLVGCTSLDDAAAVADNMKRWGEKTGDEDFSSASPVAAVVAAVKDSADSRLSRLEEMMLQMKSLVMQKGQNQAGGNGGASQNNNNGRGRGRYRSRSRSQPRFFNGLCFYHHKHGKAAFKCDEGCARHAEFVAKKDDAGNSKGMAL